MKENQKDIPILPPDVGLRLTPTSSNYPCLEHVFMVPKVFEPLTVFITVFEVKFEHLYKGKRDCQFGKQL